MARPLQLIHHRTAAELDLLAKSEKVARVRDRLRFVALLTAGWSVNDAATGTGLKESTAWRWVARYNAEGPEGLSDRPRPGGPKKIAGKNEALLHERIAKGAEPGLSRLRGRDVQAFAKEKLGVKMSLGTAFNELERAGYTLLRPKAKHEMNDPVKMEEFKVEAPLFSGKSKRSARGRR